MRRHGTSRVRGITISPIARELRHECDWHRRATAQDGAAASDGGPTNERSVLLRA